MWHVPLATTCITTISAISAVAAIAAAVAVIAAAVATAAATAGAARSATLLPYLRGRPNNERRHVRIERIRLHHKRGRVRGCRPQDT